MTARTVTRIVTRIRPLTIVGVLAVLASLALSIVAYGHLGQSLRIRWAVGTHYGPEHASTLAVLGALTLTMIVVAVGSRLLVTVVDTRGGPAAVRRAVEIVSVGVLVSLLLLQTLLVGMNLLLGAIVG